MAIKYVSVCEWRAPPESDNPEYLRRLVCFGRQIPSTGFMFEPFLLAEKKVLKLHRLPRTMSNRKEVREWLKMADAKYLFDIVAEVEPIEKKIINDKDV